MGDLARRIKDLSPAKRALLELRLKRREQGLSTFPLSFGQERLWFLEQLEPGSPLYNIPAAVRLSGPLDAAALAQALQQLVDRHEALRTTFASLEGRPVQVIAPAPSVPLPLEDLAGEADPEAAALERATAEAQRPFDLAEGPLLRAGLLRLGPEAHVLLLTLQHAIADDWSMGLLIRELAACYQAALTGRPAGVPPQPVQ
jgi:NRPS condensation-like uncharacterized protein